MNNYEFDQFVRDNGKDILRFCRMTCGDKDSGDELYQDTMLKLLEKTKPSVEIKTRFMFHMMGMMQKKGWNSSPVETEYWKENGWLDGKRPWDV